MPEAVIEKVRAICDIPMRVKVMGASESEAAMAALAATIKREALDAPPSTVLAAVKRETAAQALEQFGADLNEWYPEDVFPRPTAENYHDLNVALARTNMTLDRFSADLMRRAGHLARDHAAALRSGTEGNDRG
jgi:hypothetical protein